MITELLIYIIGTVLYLSYGLVPLIGLISASLFTYLLAFAVRRHTWAYCLGMFVCVSPLILLKVSETMGKSFFLPFGLSYFALQMISYLTDVRKGKTEAEKRILRVLLYIGYYPHLFVGPIERMEDFNRALDRRRYTYDSFVEGMTRALMGGMKKLLIANRLSILIGTIAADMEKYAGAYVLLAMLLYSVELYCDFSGAMDMVLGISRMFGVELSENFNMPFMSETVSEFWRRWHITLGSWLRDHIYIPLGGNRKGRIRKMINILLTFLVSGLWHGINYVLWGFINGVFVATGDILKTRSKTVNRVITFIIISFLWAYFIWPDTMSALRATGTVFTVFNPGDLLSGISGLGLTTGDFIVLGISVLLLSLYGLRKENIHNKLSESGTVLRWTIPAVMALIILVFGVYGLGFNATDFIYSRF